VQKVLNAIKYCGDRDQDAAHENKFVSSLLAALLTPGVSRKNPASTTE
jgi:hypothetical protein